MKCRFSQAQAPLMKRGRLYLQSAGASKLYGGGGWFKRGISLLARLEAASPELIIISAGFDAHQDDPLASCTLQSSDFYEITAKICGLADKVAQGRVLSLLEGGYDLPALSSSVRHHLQALQGREAL